MAESSSHHRRVLRMLEHRLGLGTLRNAVGGLVVVGAGHFPALVRTSFSPAEISVSLLSILRRSFDRRRAHSFRFRRRIFSVRP